jgi:2,3-bisphosphoglycerate-independent phosphoglycerate mutase
MSGFATPADKTAAPRAGRAGRLFLVILCGAGDRPIVRLGGRTPLQAARIPHLDDLAARGVSGLLTVIDGGIVPESDSGAMALLGYDPVTHYTGRGPLEGLGMGFWRDDEAAAAFRINFASVDRASGALDRRTARDLSDAELQELAQEVREQVRLVGCPGVRFQMTAFGRHRGILCFTSATTPLSGNVTNTDPGFRKVGAFGVPNATYRAQAERCRALDDSPGARNCARAVNAFMAESAAVLSASAVNAHRIAATKLPANAILFRDGGHELPTLERFSQRTGLTLSLYGQVPAEHGLCRLIGGRFTESRPGSRQPLADYYRELAATLAADESDLLFVHLKGADEHGHDNEPFEKVAALELIDRCFVNELASRLSEEDVLVITGDHTTPCELGIHSADPVPTVVCGGPINADDCAAFSELDAAQGGLPVTRAPELLDYLATAAVGVLL